MQQLAPEAVLAQGARLAVRRGGQRQHHAHRHPLQTEHDPQRVGKPAAATEHDSAAPGHACKAGVQGYGSAYSTPGASATKARRSQA